MAGITNLRYIKRTALKHEQNLMRGYYREIINSYGIDVVYFRKYIDFYTDPSGTVNYTYGEDPTAHYFLSGDMIVYQEQMGDSFLLSKFGIETDGDCAIYFTIEDFNEKFRNEIGVTIQSYYEEFVSAYINDTTGIVSSIIEGDEISANVSADISQLTSGFFTYNFHESLNIYHKPVNPDLASPFHYEYGQYLSTGYMNGVLSGYTDVSGNGIISGIITGDIYHNVKPAEVRGPTWDDISPQVGDFFRIDFDELNKEEYEITRVHDRDLNTDGLNPLLGKYIWKCDCVRRDPSYEVVDGDNLQEEKLTTSKVEQNQWHEDISNEIFDYEIEPVDNIDGVNSDSVYGDY